ncbi:hypothetical protein IL306_009832 [Fusarium sp. DS 682]|nr:hypothetical protein IL306_009832 [Fusarium sp. DS 682]
MSVYAHARLLIERGADAALAPEKSMNAYLMASKLGFVVLLECIIEKAPTDFPWLCVFEHTNDHDIYNAMQFAAAGGHRDALTTLMEATPLIDEIGKPTPRLGRTVAHLAAKSGSIDCVKILKRHDEDLFHVRDLAGRTPVSLVSEDNEELVEYMRENLLDPDFVPDLDE